MTVQLAMLEIDDHPRRGMSARELIEFAAAWAETVFTKFGYVDGLYHALCSDGTHLVIPCNQGLDKREQTLAVRTLFRDKGVVTYVFVNEAWLVEGELSESERAWVLEHGISAHPARKEAVILQAEDRHGELTGRRYITRRKNGKPSLGSVIIDRPTQSEGPASGMLPSQGRKQ